MLTAALIAVVPGRLPRVPDLQAELRAFDAVERQAIDAYNAALQPGKKLTDLEIAAVIDQQVLPPWRQFADRWSAMSRVRRLPAEQKDRIIRISRYLDLRDRGWATFSEALRAGDQAKADRAVALLKESESVFKDGSGASPK